MSSGVEVDPNLVQQAYQQMLTEANSQVALLKAAATGLQRDKNQLEEQVKQLKTENDELRKQTGRKDGVPKVSSS